MKSEGIRVASVEAALRVLKGRAGKGLPCTIVPCVSGRGTTHKGPPPIQVAYAPHGFASTARAALMDAPVIELRFSCDGVAHRLF